jgi:hypothetical protein
MEVRRNRWGERSREVWKKQSNWCFVVPYCSLCSRTETGTYKIYIVHLIKFKKILMYINGIYLKTFWIKQMVMKY